MKKTSVHWTPAETKFIRDKWGELSPEEIKTFLSHPRTVLSIIVKARRMGLPTQSRKGLTEYRINFIKKFKHKTSKELADLLGISQQYVNLIARENSIKLVGHGNRRYTTQEESDQIIDRFLTGERVVDIAKDYPHLKYSHVYSRVSKFISLGNL